MPVRNRYGPAQRLITALAQITDTQAEVAARIGLTPSHLSAVKHGRQPLTDRTAYALEREFGISATWLLTGEGPEHAPTITCAEPTTTTTQEMDRPTVQVVFEPHCGECGGRVFQGADRCPHCGVDLEWPPEGEK